MSIRARWRSLRMFYKSWQLFKQMLIKPYYALALPWFSMGNFKTTNGIEFNVPRNCWYVLPNFLRLAAIGAVPSVERNFKRVKLNGITLDSPLGTKEEGIFFREIFVEDVYRIRDSDLTGMVVVDIGAYIGDSAIAFALKGATVFALEPSQLFFTFLKQNIVSNNFADRIYPFPVGLSNKAQTITISTNGVQDDSLVLVDAMEFVLQELPSNIEYLKLDCEGCEYHLLNDDRFLEHLQPRRISMEYHHGLQDLPKIFERAGYKVEVEEIINNKVGYLYAVK